MSQQPGQAGQSQLSDTVERMLRPQGIFQNPQPRPFDWQQTYASPPAAPEPWGASAQGQSTLPHGATPVPAGYQQAPGAHQPAGVYPPPPGYPPAPQHPPGNQYPAGAQYPAEALLQTGAQPQAPGQQAAGYPAGGPFGPPGSAYPGQYPTGQIPQAQYPPYGQGQFPPPPFPPGTGYGQDGAAPGGPVSGLRGKLTQRPLIPLAVAGAAVLVVVGALILSSQGGQSANNTGGPGAGGGTSPSGSASSSSGTTQVQAATALNGLLEQSGIYRAQVSVAYDNVLTCSKDLNTDVSTFTKSAANRRTLLAKLQSLPGRQTLPGAMLADLTSGWQASIAVDSDLAKWAKNAAGHCHKGNQHDANLVAQQPYETQASVEKAAFVVLWNRLAKKDSLPTYTSSDI
jgi:hypothetical protein